MVNGWIHLHRKILDCSLWSDNEPHNRRSAWIDLLLLANHHDKIIIFDGQKMVITRGQYLTSVRKLSERWHWSANRTQRYLKLLEELEMIHRDSNTKRTLITIANYEVYQDTQNSNGDSNGDSSGDTGEHTGEHTGIDADEHTDGLQYKNIKNVKNNKNIKKSNRFVAPSVDDVKAYCQERDNNVDAEAFVNFYQSKGWKVGNNSMKDWKAAVRTWEKRKNTGKPKNSFNNFAGREYDLDDLERKLLGG